MTSPHDLSEEDIKALRRSPEKHKIPEQNPLVRSRNFNEVALGYDEESAIREAYRCLLCKNPGCVKGCPVNIDIPSFIRSIQDGNFQDALQSIRKDNMFPAICGRVCPQETQCEMLCVRGKKAEPVGIGRLERFVADWAMEQGEEGASYAPPKTGKKAAVVGSGPAGLTVAADLARLGHKVDVFEALHEPGGVLTYGIPEFRLPKAIIRREVEYLARLGVEVHTSKVIGRVTTIDEMFDKGYHAVFIGTGAGLPRFMKIPGENLNGVYSSNEFLVRANLMRAYQFPEWDTPIKVGRRVAVIGGGNVAMDSARVALRLGSKEVTIVYRRSRTELPARAEEVDHAEEEGIVFKLLNNPVRILGDDGGNVVGMECIRMELGEPDDSGRRRPVPVEGSEFIIDVDIVIVAIGTNANPLIADTTPDMEFNKWGYIVTDEETGKTNKEGVWAGGDIVTGAATVISAMGAGRNAARSMHEYMMALD